jgi:phytol kinase
MLNNNFLALGLTLIIAITWLRINDFLAHKGLVPSKISRKIIHIGTGPIFVLCWLLFNTSKFAPFFAAIVPLGITVQFALVGSGLIKDPSAVEAMSRSGDRKEILRGPLYYGIVFVLTTIIFWRNSPIGIVALMILCGGDGLADIIGSFIGGQTLPWSPRKTLIGSLTMFLGGLISSTAIIWVFVRMGYLQNPLSNYFFPLILISFVTTMVESLPFENIDNITVPLVSVLLGLLVF